MFDRRAVIDVIQVLIDEAGQVSLGTAALVIRFLSERGKLVLAGDHQQLAPILGTSYPESEGTPPLFGSILDTLMSGRRELRHAPLGNRADSTDEQTTDESDGTVVQLLENWRCAYSRFCTFTTSPPPPQTKRGPGRICRTHLLKTIHAHEISRRIHPKRVEALA
jgi:hypothetical protein